MPKRVSDALTSDSAMWYATIVVLALVVMGAMLIDSMRHRDQPVTSPDTASSGPSSLNVTNSDGSSTGQAQSNLLQQSQPSAAGQLNPAVDSSISGSSGADLQGSGL